MSPDFVTGFFIEALKIAMLLAAPMLGAGLIVGLLVSMFQAATQINDCLLYTSPSPRD